MGTSTWVAGMLLAAGVATGEPGSQLPAPQEPERRTAISVAAAVSAAGTPVVAWLDSGAGQRVFAAAGGAAAIALGPPAAGSDGLPAAAASTDGSVWVVAARFDGNAQRLWTQRFRDGAWAPAVAGPFGRQRNHHPAIAADPVSAGFWTVWVGDEATSESAFLFASRWTGNGWTPVEVLPRTVGTPMAPAIAVDATGRPMVAWAASDGLDAEVWVSTRDNGGRWSTPRRLTDNQVPDIMPSIAFVAGEWTVGWIGYADNGYLPRARSGRSVDLWGPASTLSTQPGDRLQVAEIAGAAAVFWRQLDDNPAGGVIRVRARSAAAWSEPIDLTAAGAAPFSAAGSANGTATLAWSGADGGLEQAHAERRGASAPEALRGLRPGFETATGGLAAAATTPPGDAPADAGGIPERYSAFGDSITEGVVVDPESRHTPGYIPRLQSLLRGFFGFGDVTNDGAGGETTAGGAGRIKSVVSNRNPDAVLVMEGTNDVTFLIDAGTSAFNLRTIVQRAKQEKPGILRFLALVPPRNDPANGFGGPFNRRTDELNAFLPAVADEENVTLVDMNTPFLDREDLYSDHVHPTDEGYRFMGEVWYDGVRPVAAGEGNRGDVDGSGRVDIADLVRLALAFGAMTGEARFDAEADINGDGIIDGFDLGILSEFFGQEVGAS